MKSIYKLITIACCLLFVACVDDWDKGGNTVTTNQDVLQLRFTPEDAFTLTSTEDTRATTENVVENDLQNLWVLLFDADSVRIDPDPSNTEIDELYVDGVERQGISEDDKIFGSTYISSYQSEQIIYLDKDLSAQVRHIRAVANTMTTNEYFNKENCGSLAEYNEISFELKDNAYRESDMWNEFGDLCYLRMSGNWDGVISDEGLDFNIAILAKPIAAKITVDYTCIDETVAADEDRAPSTIDVTSVQITRVPKYCYYKDVDTDNAEAHEHTYYTSYQPRLVYDETYLGAKTGNVSFYTPQNMKGTAGSSDPAVTDEEKATLSPESLKTLYHATDAMCVVITGLYKYWDTEKSSMEKKYVYIQLYPGENSYDNFDVKLRHEYHLNCTITAEVDTIKWDTDYRVTLSEVLPEGAIVHYEFDPNNLTLNSAYDVYRQPLGDYPRTEGVDGYHEYLDTYRSPTLIRKNATTSDGTVRSTTDEGYYYQGYTDNDGTYHAYAYDDAGVFDLGIDGLSDYYDRYFCGFWGTTNAIATRYTEEGSDSLFIKSFLRNLAARSTDTRYNNEDGHNPYYRLKSHPEIFDCTLIKDNFNRYGDTYTSGFSSGELTYYYPNTYINSSFLQLSTGWGAGLNPNDTEFTIIFIGSLGKNTEHNTLQDRGVYYGNSIDWNKRWYFYRIDTNLNSTTDGNISYGLLDGQLIKIDALIAEDNANVQSYDICDYGSRKVYYNNVDVEAVPTGIDASAHYSTVTVAADRPSIRDFVFDAPISIFGHTTVSNKDDALNGKLRLFLIYDRALTLDEIDQVRRYAATKGLLLYGVNDYDGFDVKVTPEYEAAWDSEVIWNDGGGDSVTF